ncbi:MAG: hypothetical protein AAGM22_17250 [Acidobacteriota bacterium]
MRPVLSTLVPLVLLFASASFAQPPAETCGAGDSLDMADTLPVSVSTTPATDDFTLTGTGCEELGVDHVTCLTPTNSCVINARCGDPVFLSGGAAKLGVQGAVNVVEGSCSTNPASCTASAAGTGSGTVNNVALTAGTQYCFICETDFPDVLQLDLTLVSGDCGGLPVSLQSFAID